MIVVILAAKGGWPSGGTDPTSTAIFLFGKAALGAIIFSLTLISAWITAGRADRPEVPVKLVRPRVVAHELSAQLFADGENTLAIFTGQGQVKSQRTGGNLLRLRVDAAKKFVFPNSPDISRPAVVDAGIEKVFSIGGPASGEWV